MYPTSRPDALAHFLTNIDWAEVEPEPWQDGYLVHIGAQRWYLSREDTRSLVSHIATLSPTSLYHVSHNLLS